MSFLRNNGLTEEFDDYTEEELNFIFGNINIKHPDNEIQREAILTAFQQAKEECLTYQNKNQLPKEPENTGFISSINQTNQIVSNYIVSNYTSYPPEKKHRHFHSFFNKFKSHRTLPEIATPFTPSPIVNYSPSTLPNPIIYKFDQNKFLNYEVRLVAADDDHEAREVIKEMLADEGDLWKGNNSNVNAFNNLFLASLRHTTIEGYRQIIEEQYLQKQNPPVKFQVGEIDLFRGDKRDYQQIFKNGFDLWPRSNLETTPKLHYTSDHGQVGISTSRKTTIPLSFAGQFFKIHLPANHHLLAIPFANTYQDEINFMDNIPPQYIESFVSGSGNEIKNPNYSPNEILSPKIRRGCY